MSSSTLQIQIFDKFTGKPLQFAKAHLGDKDHTLVIADNDDVDGDWDERLALHDNGYIAFQKVDAGPAPVLIRMPGYEDQFLEPVMMPHDALIEVQLVRKQLPRLTRIDKNRHRMVNERGEPTYGRGASAFLIFKKYLDGGPNAVRDFLNQMQDHQINLLRIMGMLESLGGFNPKPYGSDYYKAIPQFYREELEPRGFYGLWTACAATGTWMNEDEALHHTIDTFNGLLQTQGAIGSYVNEQGEHNNSVDRQKFFDNVPHGWMLYDTGSFGGDKKCERPFGTHAVLHTNRAYPSCTKDGNIVDHPNHVADDLEVGIDEPYRMGDEGSGGDGPDGPHGYRSTQMAREAAGSAYTALFYVAHSMQGERADVLTGNTLECFAAAADAMKGH